VARVWPQTNPEGALRVGLDLIEESRQIRCRVAVFSERSKLERAPSEKGRVSAQTEILADEAIVVIQKPDGTLSIHRSDHSASRSLAVMTAKLMIASPLGFNGVLASLQSCRRREHCWAHGRFLRPEYRLDDCGESRRERPGDLQEVVAGLNAACKRHDAVKSQSAYPSRGAVRGPASARGYPHYVALPITNAAFCPPAGWYSGHLQTIRSRVLPGLFDLRAVSEQRQVLVEAADGSGDQLSVMVHRSKRFGSGGSGGGARVALVLLVHGLGGSSASDYITNTAHGLLQLGFNVARVDLRGAGLSKDHSRAFYHAGKTEDLRLVLEQLAKEPESKRPKSVEPALAAVGFSLGGNQVIKLLAEPLAGSNVLAGATVSAPLDLAVGSEHLHHMAFGLYEKYLLRALKRDSLEMRPDGSSRVSATERDRIRAAKDIVDFDNAVTAPRNGWRDAEEYYRVNSSGQFLPAVARPLLVVHALDDPMIPSGPYRAIDWADLDRGGHVSRAVTDLGGHVGFHERGRQHRWFVPVIARFLAQPHPNHRALHE
jgi:predicted alpha/beta-fold hydrolase